MNRTWARRLVPALFAVTQLQLRTISALVVAVLLAQIRRSTPLARIGSSISSQHREDALRGSAKPSTILLCYYEQVNAHVLRRLIDEVEGKDPKPGVVL